VGRLSALKAWTALTEGDRLLASEGARRLQTVWADRPRTELRFCPHGATWLNHRRWEDEPDSVAETPHITSAAEMKALGEKAIADAEASNARRK
jgi:hypothetical protein